ncbi:MAG: PKD domain-containing protein [Bacteroidota bacterium]
MTISLLKNKGNFAKRAFRFFSLLWIAFLCPFLKAQSLTYLKTAQVNALNFGLALAPTTDSGYVMVGQDKEFVISANVYCYFYATKFDKCGDINKRIKFELVPAGQRVRSAGARYIRQTANGKFIVTGAIQRANLAQTADSLSLYAAQIDMVAGTLDWINIYRKPGGEAQGTCIAEASDGYVVCGIVDSEPKKPYIAKLSKTDGSVIWETAFPSLAGLYSYANYVEVFNNGDILLLGSYGNGPGNNFFAMRLSPTGTIIWSKEYDIGPYDGLDWDVSGKITQNGGFILSGSTKTGSNYDCALIKADANGTVLNCVTFDKNGNDDRARGVTELADGNIVQAGFTDANNGNVYALLNKFSGNLSPVWSRNLTFNNYTKAWGINEDVDKGLVFSGETLFPPSNYEALFVKTDSLGNLPGCTYLPLIAPVSTQRTIVASTIIPTFTTGTYYEHTFTGGEKVVVMDVGVGTNVCYNCEPVLVLSSNKICLNETMSVYSTEIRCSPQTISIADTITNQVVPAVSSNSDTTFYHFTTAGTYHITLTLTCGGMVQTTVKTLVVEPPPVASAGNDFTKCKYQSVPITGTGGVNYQWYNQDFSTLLSTSNPFNANDTAEKTYNVVVTDINGCIDTADVLVSVTLPQAKFFADSACLHQPSSYTDVSTVLNQTFTGWSWDFGDNSTLNSAQNPTHIFPNFGTFNTTLIATTANGCKDTVTNTILIHPLPTVNFYTTPFPSGICLGTSVSFFDLTTIPLPDYIEFWNWDFDDGSPVNINQNNSHLYDSADTYHIQLEAISNFGCIDSISKVLTINPNPVVKFMANDTVGCEPLCISFTDLSTITHTNITQWTWTVGDGSPANNTPGFEHCYINDSVFAPNYFSQTLTVTSDSGCVSTGSKNNYITVYPNPVANFTTDPHETTVIDPVITYIDASVGTDFWNWDLGDSHTSALHNPLPHMYPTGDTGTYTIGLITSTQYGCYDTAFQTIIIGPDFVFYIPNAFSPNADGINDHFFGSGIGIGVYNLWILDRWGNLIFHGNDLNDKWDGKANQGKQNAQIDVYIWKVELTDVFHKKHNYLGTVTLVE